MLFSILLVIAGVALLYFGGELLVQNASSLALSLHVSPLVIGLTVVAFGTSAPELAAAALAAGAGHPSLAVGNVVGSNVANIGLILGITVLIVPLDAHGRFVRREVVFMIGTGVLLVGFVATGELSRWQAVVLLGLMALFLWILARDGRIAEELRQEDEDRRPVLRLLVGVTVGVLLLVGGAKVLVDGAVDLAMYWGISERVVGLTVVAVGTSIPELASSLVALFRRNTEIILGNIVGSNVFNTLLILPTAMLIEPIPVSWSDFGLDLVVMLVFSAALFVFFLSGNRLTRLEGALFLAGYLGYILFLSTGPLPSHSGL